jgi:hypothetical protein
MIEHSKDKLSEIMAELQLTQRSKRTILKALRYRNGSTLLGAVGLFVAVQLLLMIPLVVVDIDDNQIKSFLTCGVPILSALFVIYSLSVFREAACAKAFIELLSLKRDLGE